MKKKINNLITSRLHRSELAVPGSSLNFFEKAFNSDADYVFLDLEDSVAIGDKVNSLKIGDRVVVFPGFHKKLGLIDNEHINNHINVVPFLFV